jgi:hypothetical protein
MGAVGFVLLNRVRKSLFGMRAERQGAGANFSRFQTIWIPAFAGMTLPGVCMFRFRFGHGLC